MFDSLTSFFDLFWPAHIFFFYKSLQQLLTLPMAVAIVIVVVIVVVIVGVAIDPFGHNELDKDLGDWTDST